MSKLIVSANSKKHLDLLLNKKIDGVIISICDLAVNDDFYLSLEEFRDIDFMNKEVFININKIMHNDDLNHLRDVMKTLKEMDVKILFYDMAVYGTRIHQGS